MANYKPIKVLEYIRDGLVEQEHYGLLIRVSNNNIFKSGDDNNYPFYLRSCAKPLQASLIIDFGIDEFFNMTIEEIAISCASHAGEPCHVKVVSGFLKKIGLDESYLKCGLHKPLSKSEQNKLILSGKKENVLQNNCSGKHAMMLAICKKMGWDVNDYDNVSHPLQLAIKNKIYELCEVKNEYPVTKDGCGVPIHSMPLVKMVKGYINLFCNDRYSKIRQAFINNPYLIGGEDRIDTAIMSMNKNLIAKVGACGLCMVIHTEKGEGVIVKIMDSDMRARAIVLINILKQLHWLGEKVEQIGNGNSLIKEQNNTSIVTLHGEKIGEIRCADLLHLGYDFT